MSKLFDTLILVFAYPKAKDTLSKNITHQVNVSVMEIGFI